MCCVQGNLHREGLGGRGGGHNGGEIVRQWVEVDAVQRTGRMTFEIYIVRFSGKWYNKGKGVQGGLSEHFTIDFLLSDVS